MLRRKDQIAGMIRTLNDGGLLPPIVIIQNEKDEFQVEDGHHRLMAHWLSGKDHLEKEDYMLIQKDQWKPKLGKIGILLTQCQMFTSSLRQL